VKNSSAKITSPLVGEVTQFIVWERGILILICAICLFLSSCSFTQTNEAPVVDFRNQQELARGYHVVAPGETVYFIAWRFNMDYQELAKRNDLAAPYRVKVGEKIYLTSVAPVQKATHKIKHEKPIKAKLQGKAAPVPNQKTNYHFAAVKHWLRPAKGTIIHGFSATNKGVDIAGREGEAVCATAVGEIVYAGDGLRGYGNLLLIKHNDEYISAYAHNEKLLVKEGQFVKAGQEIASMGQTGTNWVMLHFELRKNGKAVNPLKYF
jgi:lipoprotein NlpD